MFEVQRSALEGMYAVVQCRVHEYVYHMCKQSNHKVLLVTMSKPGPKPKLTQTHHAGVYKADSIKVREPYLRQTAIEMVHRMWQSL